MPLFKRSGKNKDDPRGRNGSRSGGDGDSGSQQQARGYVGSHVVVDPSTSTAPSLGNTTSPVSAGQSQVSPSHAQLVSEEAAEAATEAADDANGNNHQKPFKYGRHLSKTRVNVGGLPVNVYGLAELTSASARALAPAPPEVCIAIHMHGRGGSANNEEHIVRQLWDRAMRSQKHHQQQHGNQGGRMRELLFVGFDGRNHGHRKTDALGQKGWKQDNPKHGMDLYSMIVGTAHDVSFLVDFLPSYLFPHDERHVTQWAVTGKSLGGHSTWHVLANDRRIPIGVPFISCPSYAALMERRTKTAFVSNGPPYIPGTLAQLVARIDPASQPFDQADPHRNPFWGKKICMLNGGADKIVPWKCAEDFVRRLAVGPREGPNGEQRGFRISLREGLGHEVTEDMVEEGGHWIFMHGVIA